MATGKIYADSETGCCKRFNPEPWQDREVRLKDKLFLMDSVKSVFHIPINFGAVMKKNMEKIAAAGALTEMPLMLSDEKSMWGSDIYIAVSKDVPNSNMVKLSGSFLTKVFEGAYKDMGKWIKEMDAFVASKGKKSEKLYFFYTTCPKCAKFYGKNYVVILAKIA
jgi:hypothetical protein